MIGDPQLFGVEWPKEGPGADLLQVADGEVGGALDGNPLENVGIQPISADIFLSVSEEVRKNAVLVRLTDYRA